MMIEKKKTDQVDGLLYMHTHRTKQEQRRIVINRCRS